MLQVASNYGKTLNLHWKPCQKCKRIWRVHPKNEADWCEINVRGDNSGLSFLKTHRPDSRWRWLCLPLSVLNRKKCLLLWTLRSPLRQVPTPRHFQSRASDVLLLQRSQLSSVVSSASIVASLVGLFRCWPHLEKKSFKVDSWVDESGEVRPRAHTAFNKDARTDTDWNFYAMQPKKTKKTTTSNCV